MSIRAIGKLTQVMNRGATVSDFCKIFNVPKRRKPEIDLAIEEVFKTFGSYGQFVRETEKNENASKRYQPFLDGSADIFGYIAISIKLAGEGYVTESLTVLRSSIDAFITSLFASLTWDPANGREEINPLAEIDSPYYHRLEEITLDDLIVNKIGLGQESEGILLEQKINESSTKAFDEYLLTMEAGENEIIKKEYSRYIKKIKKAFSDITVDALRKNQSDKLKALSFEVTSPENILLSLMQDERYTFKACPKHEESLLLRLKERLGISGEMTDELRVDLKKLTFIWDLRQSIDDKKSIPVCDDCENSPSIWSIHIRFNKNSMLKYMEWHINSNSKNKIDDCIKSALSLRKRQFFGDLINYKIYKELNPYSHGDPKEEPNANEWYNSYMRPFLVALSCIYYNLASSVS